MKTPSGAAYDPRRFYFDDGELFFSDVHGRHSPSLRGEQLMRTDTAEKVLEKLATSDKATIVIERQPDGKMRVTSWSWDGGEGVFARSGARGPQR
jgi:hypothetical protein